MKETDTIEALGEYWDEKIYRAMFYADGRPIAPEYLAIRARELAGLTADEYIAR